MVRAVALGCRDIRLVREGFASEEADIRVVPAFREVIAGLQFVLAPANLAGDSRGEVIGKRQKDLGAKCLEKSSPGFPRQRGLEGTDALGRDDRDTFGLPRQAEELLITGRLAFTDCGEVLILIAEK